MLSPSHNGLLVNEKLSFRDQPSSPHAVLAQLRALKQPRQATSEHLLQDRSAVVAIEAFAHQHMSLRDELAWRAAQGETLSLTERAALHALDAVLDSLEPPSAALPALAQQILGDLARR